MDLRLTEILGHEPSNDLWASTLNLPFSQLQSKISDAHRARDQMFISNLRLVFSVANKYTGHGLSFSDLVQVTIEESSYHIMYVASIFFSLTLWLCDNINIGGCPWASARA